MGLLVCFLIPIIVDSSGIRIIRSRPHLNSSNPLPNKLSEFEIGEFTITLIKGVTMFGITATAALRIGQAVLGAVLIGIEVMNALKGQPKNDV